MQYERTKSHWIVRFQHSNVRSQNMISLNAIFTQLLIPFAVPQQSGEYIYTTDFIRELQKCGVAYKPSGLFGFRKSKVNVDAKDKRSNKQ